MHGANAVCDVHPPIDALTVAVLVLGAALAIGLGLALWRGGLSRWRAAALFLGAVLLAGPGLGAVWLERADAPLHAGASAEQVSVLEQQLETFAAAREGCVEELRNDCEECQPVVRFVFPIHTACGPPRGRFDLRRDALDGPCQVSGDTLQCGNASADPM